MSRIAARPVDDPALDWGPDGAATGAFVRALAALPPGEALANARFDLAALQLTDRAFALVLPTGPQGCWLTALTATYGKALRDEIDRDLRGPKAGLARLASLAVEGLLRLTRADRVVHVNHLLFSTSLYGRWTGEDLGPALAALRAAYPDRAIVWRSLNPGDHPALLARMDAAGGRRLVSRVVWRLEDPARDWAPRTDVKADLKLAVAGGLTAEATTDPSTDDLGTALALYERIYRDRYSTANPSYRPAFLRAAVESGVLDLRLVRDAAGTVQAFAADQVCETVLASPMLGYDPDRPRATGLYRIAMSLSVLRALERGLAVNYSGGAGVFKRNRGGRPALEVSVVFDDHLPPWRRAGYAALEAVLKALTPALERIALR